MCCTTRWWPRAFPIATGMTRDRDARRVRCVFGAQREGPFDLVVDALGASSPLRAALPGCRARCGRCEFGAVWGTVPWVDEGFDDAALMQRYERASVMIGVLPIGRQHAGRAAAGGVLLVAQMAGAPGAARRRLRGLARAGGVAVAGDGAASRRARRLRVADAGAVPAPDGGAAGRRTGWWRSATRRIRPARSSGRGPTWRCSMRGR